MLRRVESLIGMNISGLFGGTFHHVANLLLRQHCSLSATDRGFRSLTGGREGAVRCLYRRCL